MIIPVDMNDVPDRQSPLDESLVYRFVLRKIDLVEKRDKNGDRYCKVDTEVISGDYKGRHIPDNYVRIPVGTAELETRLGRKPSEFEAREAGDKGVRFAQLVKCFTVPFTPKGIDPQNGLGREGNVTIKNEEYPQGSGDMRSKVNQYLPPGN
jgi:hypothetical protein